jgi:hypothetical protein
MLLLSIHENMSVFLVYYKRLPKDTTPTIADSEDKTGMLKISLTKGRAIAMKQARARL